ncbi:hypothetical protein ACHAXT_006734 [Thalassiosira profunda]
MSRRYYYHSELEHHKDEEWVFLDKDGHFVDLDSSIDPSGGARRGHGNKSWGECNRGARYTIMVGMVQDLEKERQEKWRETYAEIEAYLKSEREQPPIANSILELPKHSGARSIASDGLDDATAAGTGGWGDGMGVGGGAAGPPPAWMPAILERLRDNDPKLTKLVVCHALQRFCGMRGWSDFDCYCPSADEDLGRAGVFIGNNNTLQELGFLGNLFLDEANDSLSVFFRGVSRSRSICRVDLSQIDLSNGDILRAMDPFFENYGNPLTVQVSGCQFGGKGDLDLALMLRSCRSLEGVYLEGNLDEGEHPTSIITSLDITALSSRTQLKWLSLVNMNVGWLWSLVSRPFFSKLRGLNLIDNNIDDDGVRALTGALASGNSLLSLKLSHNPLITTRGLQKIAHALQYPTTNLLELELLWNGVDDEGAEILARALASNRKLRSLILVAGDKDKFLARRLRIVANDNIITAEGWQAFVDVLYNKSSLEATYQSNHTLQGFGNKLPSTTVEGDGALVLYALRVSLETNRMGANEAARRKIIDHHLSCDEGMGYFVGIERAALPRAIAWVPDDELSPFYRVVRNLHSELVVVPKQA